MAERNTKTQALILTVREQGENNRLCLALSPDLGLFYSTLYGGPKSKMRSLVQPFNSGTLFLYNDEVRHSSKITDFDVKNCHPTLRTNIYKMWASNLAAELVMKTKCGGDFKMAFILLSALVDGMDASTEEGARLGMIRFLWRYLGLLGVQPDVKHCVSCGCPLDSCRAGEFSYIIHQNGFVCPDCLPSFSGNEAWGNVSLGVSAGGLFYLNAINEETPAKVRALRIDEKSAYDIKRLVYILIEQAAGTRLNALESGGSIL